MKSIQSHLTVRLLCAVLAVAAGAGAFLYLYARARLTGEFDRALIAKAGLVSGMALWEREGKFEFNGSEAELAEFRDARRPGYFEFWRDDGTVFTRSPSLGGRDLPRLPAGRPPAPLDLKLPDGRMGRGIAVRFIPRGDEDDEQVGKSDGSAAASSAPAPAPSLTLLLAQDRGDLDATLRVLATSLLLSAFALAFGTVLAVTLSVRRGLRPLRRLATEADSISAGSLHHRFSTAGLPRELQPIGYRLNSLLTRLGRAFARERRFTADAAHELRTPIAELRSLAEVALKWPEATSAEQNYRDALRIATHMESLVTALLAIARCGAGAQPVRVQAIDLAALVQEVWLPHWAAAASRGLVVNWDVAAGTAVRSDRALLLPLVDNLLSNAVAYTPDRGTIECRLFAREACVELVIANTASGLRREDLQHLFDPFWRKDPARPGGHCGLGLSLVAAYADALGAAVSPTLEEQNMFRVAVAFPAHQWTASEEKPVRAETTDERMKAINSGA